MGFMMFGVRAFIGNGSFSQIICLIINEFL
jgi:hypothetical protein